MKQPKKRGNISTESLKQSKINALEKSFEMLVEIGPEKWTQSYTLSHADKLHQLEQMREHFQLLEEYEKCQYVMDVKKSIDTHRFML